MSPGDYLMEPSELLRRFAEVLECLHIPYLVTGSMATIAYGEPRFTNDIDVVVALPLDQVDAFCAKKLEYSREGGSDKHIRDIAGVLELLAERVDRDHITVWVNRLGLNEVWQDVLQRVDTR
jgi:hypothetical protein